MTVCALVAKDSATVERGGSEREAQTIAPEAELASAPAPSSGSAPPADEPSFLERQEHLANVRRLRTTLQVALVAWPVFGLIDALIDWLVQPGVLLPLVLIRLAFMPFLAYAVIRLRRRTPPSPRELRGLQATCFGGASASIGLMCVWYGGLSSGYLNGVAVGVALQGAAFAEPWRRGVLLVGLTSLAGPLALLGAALFVPELAAQLRDPAAVGIYAQHSAFILAVGGFSVLGTHMEWALRRQVFESRSIGRYRLQRRIGRGGMGEVWAAWHHGLRRSVALKILRANDARQSAVTRFEREVAALGELTHPNAVRVFDYGVTEDGIWYYAMELLEGEDLGKLAAREAPLPAARAVHLVWQATRALEEAHRQGIVHRDIKPENLFVTRAGSEGDFIKVLDFGIAKRSDHDATLTQAGWVGGTPTYMSPEAAAGRSADARSDVYALGVVLYQLLAGRPPFEGESAPKMLYAHLHEDVPPLDDALEVPEDLAVVVTRCLEKSPSDRYDDAGALAAALEACACFGTWRPPTAQQNADPTREPAGGRTRGVDEVDAAAPTIEQEP